MARPPFFLVSHNFFFFLKKFLIFFLFFWKSHTKRRAGRADGYLNVKINASRIMRFVKHIAFFLGECPAPNLQEGYALSGGSSTVYQEGQRVNFQCERCYEGSGYMMCRVDPRNNRVMSWDYTGECRSKFSVKLKELWNIRTV